MPSTAATAPLTAPQKALRKLGLVRDIDLALHLPLRYEDETRLMRLADVRDGETGQFEASGERLGSPEDAAAMDSPAHARAAGMVHIPAHVDNVRGRQIQWRRR